MWTETADNEGLWNKRINNYSRKLPWENDNKKEKYYRKIWERKHK